MYFELPTSRVSSGLAVKYSIDKYKLARHKRSRLFGLFVCEREKRFYNIDTEFQCYETFFLCHLQWLMIS
jgi:hypothetical protein